MARNNYQDFVELNVSTCGADPRNCGGVNRCRQQRSSLTATHFAVAQSTELLTWLTWHTRGVCGVITVRRVA